MPATTQVSDILKKLGTRFVQAWDAVKDREVSYGQERLPPGIKGGKAQLKSVEFGEFKGGPNKGEPFVLFKGVAHSPEMHNGKLVRGKPAMLTVPLCNTTYAVYQTFSEVEGSFENWVDYLRNEIAKFGYDTKALNGIAIETVVKDLNRKKPWFQFQTRGFTPKATKEKPNPEEFVETIYEGVCDPPEDADASNYVRDRGATPSANGHAEPPAPTPSSAQVQYSDDGDLDSLAVRADQSKDQDAIDKLNTEGLKIGLTQKQIDDDFGSWAEVVERIKNPPTPVVPFGPVKGGKAKAGGAAKFEPPQLEKLSPFAVKSVVMYKGKDPVSKKRDRKATEHRVTAVDTTEETCDLESLDDPNKKYFSVTWEEMDAT